MASYKYGGVGKYIYEQWSISRIEVQDWGTLILGKVHSNFTPILEKFTKGRMNKQIEKMLHFIILRVEDLDLLWRFHFRCKE